MVQPALFMTVRGEMAKWRSTSARSKTRAMRDGRQRREGRDGRRFEVRSSRFPELQTPNPESRFSGQSRPSRLSQASAIAAKTFMNNAG